MDWLEELVDKFGKRLKRADLRKSLFFYLLAAIFSVLALYLFTKNICDGWIGVLKHRYPEMEFREGNLHIDFSAWYGAAEGAWLAEIVCFIYNYCIYLYIGLALAAALLLFYRNRLYPAIRAEREALEYLLIGDYGHEFAYQSEDELGMLCIKMEELRQKLAAEKRRQWENQEDLRKINAAFAHDIRTPITVMKGYTEFLLKYIPKGKISEEQLLEKLGLMLKQQDRLYEFSKTMTDIRNLEMREPESRRYRREKIEAQVEEAAKTLAAQWGKKLVFSKIVGDEKRELLLDMGLVMEVVENLCQNALRYAKEQVDIQLVYEKHKMTVYVRDDGAGFSPRALREASGAYYSEEKDGGEHFGMGLFICRTICEKHGGDLALINSVEGGAIAAASFRVS